MLIGIDASRANRKFKGGTEWYSFYLIRELAALDAKNKYILYSDRPLTGELAEVVKRHDNFLVKVLNWPFAFFWTQLRLSWEMLMRAPDVLFVSAHTLPYLHPAKSAVTIHDIGFERDRQLYADEKIGPRRFYGWAVNLIIGLLTGGKFKANILDYHSWSARFALKKAKAVIAVSNFTKAEIMAVYGSDGKKIKVVHDGFNDAVYKLISDREKINRILDKYGIKPPYIFYVGRLEKKKNTPALIGAYAKLRASNKNLNHKLVLAGNASLGFDEVKYLIEEFDLNKDVILPGWVKEEDLPYLFAGADLFVFPSHYEGFGIPLLEAMASGAPVAASDIPPHREIAGSSAMFFDPADQRAMADTMAKVLNDKRLAASLVEMGLERAENFSLKKCARETLAVLENL